MPDRAPSRWWAVQGVVCSGVLLAGSAALAHPDVDAGKAAYRKGDFRGALARLEAAEAAGSLTEQDQVEVCWYKGAALHTLGRAPEAAASFDLLLKLRPLYQPDRAETPPPLRDAYRRRQDAWRRDHGITMSDPVLQDGQVFITLDGHTEECAAVVVNVRAAGDSSFQPFHLQRDDRTASGTLSQPDLWDKLARSHRLEVVVEALNAQGTPVARVGDFTRPASVAVSDEQVARARSIMASAAPLPAATGPAASVPERSAQAQGHAAQDESRAVSPMAVVLGVGGAGLVGLGGAGLAAALLSAVGAVAGWVTYGATFMAIEQGAVRQADPAFPAVVGILYLGLALGVAAPVALVLGLFTGVVLLGLGAAVVVLAVFSR